MRRLSDPTRDATALLSDCPPCRGLQPWRPRKFGDGIKPPRPHRGPAKPTTRHEAPGNAPDPLADEDYSEIIDVCASWAGEEQIADSLKGAIGVVLE